MTDDLKNAREAIERQIGELEGQIVRLRSALAYLDEVDVVAPQAVAKASSRRSKPAKGARTTASSASSGRRAPRGARQKQFLALLEKQPGAKAGEIAEQMGITPNQVHGLAHRLSQAGQIRKRRGGYALAS